MEEKVVDRRVRKTKRQLRLALMKLMAEKSVKDISVRELAAIADINRGTFYIHYKDVYDLLASLEDELADGLVAVCRRHNAKDSEGKTYPYLMELYQYIEQNADLCHVLLGKNVYNSEQEDADLLGTVTDVWLLRVMETGQPDTVTLYLTVEATASYRAGKGYWMNDTRLLCGDERSFRMAGLEARGTVISLREATELETATAADTAWDAEDSSAADTQP